MSKTSGSFSKGDPRINRAGRPRAGTAFSERGRARLDPDAVLDLAERVMADESIPARDRLAIVMPVIDRIYVRPPSATALQITDGRAPRDYSHLSNERVTALLAEIRGAKSIESDDDTGENEP